MFFFYAQALGSLVVFALAYFGFFTLRVKARFALAVVAVIVWFALGPAFLPLVALR